MTGNFFKGKSVIKIAGWIMAGILLACVFAFILGIGVMYLWNWLMPDIFGLGTIGYWQAFGLILLAKILFGFGGHGESNSKSKGKKDKIESKVKTEQDNLYNEWWDSEGKNKFDEYFEKKKNEKEES
ncbi:MAG: hypothetical protein JXQ23_03190 [Clostridia bacterium]|nr:hypothetical protein [Clostridia bacterium]